MRFNKLSIATWVNLQCDSSCCVLAGCSRRLREKMRQLTATGEDLQCDSSCCVLAGCSQRLRKKMRRKREQWQRMEILLAASFA
ncbi:hypothetical protein C1H46_001957 [Malus baccata]|uniref:Uncharacterized protein n=1 Tax=Malus baccata TaxID=106549 RepID=A0A540NMQ2_MALBA|nr:hypothetical protein C1H46_001957 [Malus baccata]